jgi:hypothetical protein
MRRRLPSSPSHRRFGAAVSASIRRFAAPRRCGPARRAASRSRARSAASARASYARTCTCTCERAALAKSERLPIGFEQRVGFLPLMGFHRAQLDDLLHRRGVVTVGLGLGVHVAQVVAERLALLVSRSMRSMNSRSWSAATVPSAMRTGSTLAVLELPVQTSQLHRGSLAVLGDEERQPLDVEGERREPQWMQVRRRGVRADKFVARATAAGFNWPQCGQIGPVRLRLIIAAILRFGKFAVLDVLDQRMLSTSKASSPRSRSPVRELARRRCRAA